MPFLQQGVNSASHVLFGVAAANNAVILSGFVIYQVVEHIIVGPEDDIMTDMTEFLMGLMIGKLIDLFGNVS